MSELTTLQISPPDFFGRSAEIERMIELATTPTGRYSRVLLLEGPGGIGKSMLLRRAAEELAAEHPQVRIVGPIDMDDTDYRVPINIALRIARSLDPVHFVRYLESSRRFQRKEMEHVDQHTILMHMNSTDRLFVADYTRYALENRVVILVDTVESIRETFVWSYLMRLVSTLPNTLFVLAGRPASVGLREGSRATPAPSLEPFVRMPALGQDGVYRIELVGWPKAEARAFVTQTDLGSKLPEGWVEKLLHLSRCQPLHLVLALERLQTGRMPLLEKDQAEIEQSVPLYSGEVCEELPPNVAFEQLDARGKEMYKEFERNLLLQHANTGTWAEVIRRVAHIRRRLDRGMYEQVMAFDPALPDRPEWEALLRQPWIRQRVGGYITLHDVVSELVRIYVWPIRDPDGGFRRELSRQALGIYDQEIATQGDRLAELTWQFNRGAAEFIDRAISESLELTDLMRRMQEIDRRLWVLQAERLYYQLDADLVKGYQAFVQMFNQASRESRMGLREMLLLEVQGYLSRFPPGSAEHYHIRVCEAQVAIDDGEAARGYEILEELRQVYMGPGQQYELLRLQGNAMIRMPGKAAEALEIFEQALACTRRHPELGSRVGEALMEIGWTYRQLGQWEQARDYYAEARRATPLADRTLLARIESSLAYVEALIGNYATAETLINGALGTHRRHGPPERVGSTLSIQGEVYRYQKRFTEAYAAFDEALSLFTDAQDMAWIGQVRQQYAIALIQDDPEANIDDARYHIEGALYLCREYNARAYPSALQRAARIYGILGEFTRALSTFSEGMEVAQAVSDNWFLAANAIERAELAYRLWHSSDDASFRQEVFVHQDLIEQMSKTQAFAFRDLFGRWYLVKGHVAWRDGTYGGQRERWQDALELYQKGFPLIAQGYYGSHGLHALTQEGVRLKQHMMALPHDEAIRWCDALNDAWRTLDRSGVILLGIISDIYGDLMGDAAAEKDRSA